MFIHSNNSLFHSIHMLIFLKTFRQVLYFFAEIMYNYFYMN